MELIVRLCFECTTILYFSSNVNASLRYVMAAFDHVLEAFDHMF